MENLRWDKTKPIRGLQPENAFGMPVYVTEACPEDKVFLIPGNLREYLVLASFLISQYRFVAAREVLLALGRRSAVINNIGAE